MKNDSTHDLRNRAPELPPNSPDRSSGEFVLTNPEPAPDEPDSVGQMLRHAREQAGLSVPDVAAKLRMGTKQIDALERADYAALPSGTFLRGFVRNYAKAVNVDADEALAILERTNQAASIVLASKQVTPVPAADKINVTPNARSLPVPGIRVGVAVLVALLIGAAGYYWWNFMRPGASANAKGDASAKLSAANVEAASTVTPPVAAPTATTTEVAPPTILPSATQATDASATSAGAMPAAQPTAESAGPATPATTATTASAPAPPTALPASAPFTASDSASTSSPVAPQLNLTPRTRGNVVGFTFTGESWVEVTDASGRTVLSKRFKAGDAEEIAGRAPFSIVVGNASATRMAFNGKEVDLKPHTKVAVARLTVK